MAVVENEIDDQNICRIWRSVQLQIKLFAAHCVTYQHVSMDVQNVDIQ